ncbi:MAG: flagellar basal body-associated protein FliL [Sulfurimonadaceae bacterium]|jgi:flagellar FliL protein|nr:flagellar basal body-associated protein FliL [Sulfurimonadaceae bacterium]
MAEEENKNEKSEKKSSSLLLIVIIVVLALIIIVGAVITVLLMGSDEPQHQVQNAPQVREKTTTRPLSAMDDGEDNRRLSEIGILYPLDTFTVNLKSDAGRRYLKVTMSLELNGKHIAAELDNKIPVVRDKVIRILTSKTLEEISSPKGKQKVSLQIIDTLNAILSDGQIKGLYFTEFVIQ